MLSGAMLELVSRDQDKYMGGAFRRTRSVSVCGRRNATNSPIASAREHNTSHDAQTQGNTSCVQDHSPVVNHFNMLL